MPKIIGRVFARVQRFIRFLSETVRTLAALLAVLSAIGFGAAIYGLLYTNISLLLIGITVVLVSVLVAIVLYSTAETFFRNSQHGSPGVKLQFKRVYYKYHPDGQSMEHGKHYRIVALRNGVNQFIDRYRWTGSGLIDVKLISSVGQSLVQEKKEYWYLNKVLFDSPMKKGEIKDIILRWDLWDETKEAVPFLSQPVDYPTDHLTLTVTLPSKPKQVTLYHFSDYLALETDEDRLVEKCSGDFDAFNGQIVYDIPKPYWGHKYMIGWVP